ncbi:hypothetical protein C0993_012397 [Termitomyces sp. T159_Od127]|nr:hypothetical protein C0993_012397 [Termitomyces sp. T159_Od127]
MIRRKALKIAAARAREGRAKQREVQKDISISDSSDQEIVVGLADTPINDECTAWTGGVNHEESEEESEDGNWNDTDNDMESEDEELEQLEGEELVKGLKKKWECLQKEMEGFKRGSLYSQLSQPKTWKDWKKAEANQKLGYNGLSKRSERRTAQQLCEKEEEDKVTHERQTNFEASLISKLWIPLLPRNSHFHKNEQHQKLENKVLMMRMGSVKDIYQISQQMVNPGGTPTGAKPNIIETAPAYPIHSGAAQLISPNTLESKANKGKKFDLFRKWGGVRCPTA